MLTLYLEYINICKSSNSGGNKIKTMNGVVFANLPQLVIIDLKATDQQCINKNFVIERGSINFRRKISRNCASANLVKKKLSCITAMACDQIATDWITDEYRIHYPSSCCELELGTVIDASDYTFVADTNDGSIDTLFIKHQQNVEFLPVSIDERFPDLETYEVINTPVQKLSKKNFKKMFQLKYLKLDRNGIEVIRSDTFEDLINLTYIFISKRQFFVIWI